MTAASRQPPAGRHGPARSVALWGMLAACVAGCTVEPEHPSLREAKLPTLIPAHRFAYQGTAEGGYTLSPDGRKLAWYGPHYWRTALHVRDNQTGAVRHFRVGGSVQWTLDSRRLLYTADTRGTESFHIYMIDTDDPAAKPVDLTPWPGVRAGIHQLLPADPGRILVLHNRRDPKLFDLYRLDLATGRETLVARNPGDATAPITAADGNFRGWRRSVVAQRRETEPPRPLAARKPALTKQPEETFRVLGVAADRSVLWALSDRGRDRIALVAAHPTLGWERVLFEDPDGDVSHVAVSRVTHAPLLALASSGYPQSGILDPKLREDLAALVAEQGASPHRIDILNSDADEKRLVLSVGTDVQRLTYLVDRPARKHILLARAVAEDIEAALAPMRPVTITSRDGLRLQGYLTAPRGVAPKRLPLVLHVHGGPWLRTGWGDPYASEDGAYAQFLANRGYAVLQVDFRGSTGYGRTFTNAAIGEFGGRMQDDLDDAVRWAVEQGIADPQRVAIMGWSYGGYAALTGLARTPQSYACGVSFAGPTDLATLIESFPAYWTVDLSRWHDFVGDPSLPEDREAMRRVSPLHNAGRIERPVLIIHGARDVRVRVDQSDRMVAALRGAGRAVEYLRIPDLGHTAGWWAHRLEILRRTERFLQRCLGGRAGRADWFDAVAWAWTRFDRWRQGDSAPAGRAPAAAGTRP